MYVHRMRSREGFRRSGFVASYGLLRGGVNRVP